MAVACLNGDRRTFNDFQHVNCAL